MNNKAQEKPCTCDANEDSVESCERHGTTKHTPTPWQANGTHIRYQKNAGGYRFDIAEVFRDVGSQQAEANAQFIVKAVNCHDDLLEACKVALDLVRVARDHFPKSMHDADKFKLENTCATIGKAIEKAERTMTRKLDWKTSQTPKDGRVVQIYDEGCVYWAALPDDMTLQNAADAFAVGYDFNDYTGEISCEAMLLINGEEVAKLQFTIQNKTL